MEQGTENLEFDLNSLPEPEDINDIIMNLMVNPNLSPLNYFNDFTDGAGGLKVDSKELIDSNIIALNDGSGLLSMTTHAMHHHLVSDPQKAAEILVTKAVRKMVCYGAKPIAVSALVYHINFSDPNGNYIASGIKAGLERVADAYDLKIQERKIRFDYFEEHGTQSPTLIVTLLGQVQRDKKGEVKATSIDFKTKGNNIFLLGRPMDDLGSSDYLEFYHGITNSPLPEFDLGFEVKLHKVIKDLIEENLIMSASPVGRGGLFFSLLRAGWVNGLGFDITTAAETRIDSFLFGESMGRIFVGVDPDVEDEFVDLVFESKIPFFTLGHVTRGEIRIDDESFGYIDKMSESL